MAIKKEPVKAAETSSIPRVEIATITEEMRAKAREISEIVTVCDCEAYICEHWESKAAAILAITPFLTPEKEKGQIVKLVEAKRDGSTGRIGRGRYSTHLWHLDRETLKVVCNEILAEIRAAK